MFAYVVRRLAQAVLVVFGVVLVVFLLTFLSGDPALLLLPPDATREDVLEFRRLMGFDDPLWVQFGRFVGDLLRGDFGNSWRYREPALSLVLERLPATLELAFASLAVSLVVAIPVGIISAVRKDSAADGIAMIVALLGQSIPTFWLGIMFILIFAVQLGWLPTSGRGGIEHLILPAVSLGLFFTGRLARLVRSSMLEVLGEDYVKTARAKGLHEFVVVNKHALKNAMLPVVTVIGLEFGFLLGGAVITETVFAWPGVGLLAVQSVFGRDYPVVQAIVICVSIVFVLVNLAVDLVYTQLDPRITYVK